MPIPKQEYDRYLLFVTFVYIVERSILSGFHIAQCIVFFGVFFVLVLHLVDMALSVCFDL